MSKRVSYIAAAVLALIGLFMAMMGLTVLASGPRNSTEWTIGLSALGAAALLFTGAYGYIKN